MRWGVRRREGGVETTGRSSRGKRKPEPSKDHTQAQVLKKKGAKALTNAELKALNERLNLEQNYSRMTKQKNKVDKGHDFVKTTLGLAKTAADIYNVLNGPAGKAAQEGIKTAREVIKATR